MTKFYRTACFREIGGFVREVMWDGIDCHRCRMLGWIAESVDDEELRFLHLRPMGSSQKGIWTGRVRSGYGQYFMGTSPLYLVASAAFRLLQAARPLRQRWPCCGATAVSAARGLPRYDDAGFRRFLRRYQRRCLLQGKRAATRRAERGAGRRLAGRAPVAASPWPPIGRSCSAVPFDRVTMRRGGGALPRVVPGTARPAHGDHRQRRHPVHDAPRSRAAGGLPRAATSSCADGMSVVWTSRLAGIPFPERVTGVDLMVRLLEAAAARRLRVYFLGARPEVVERAGPPLRARLPGARGGRVPRRLLRPRRAPEAVVEEIRRRGAAPAVRRACPAPSRRPGASGTAARSRRPRDHGRGRHLRRAGRLRAARAAPAAVDGDGVGLAAGHGAAQAVEALPGHQHPSTCGWPRARCAGNDQPSRRRGRIHETGAGHWPARVRTVAARILRSTRKDMCRT